LEFPKLGTQPTFDALIGLDCIDGGGIGLILLGCMCIGSVRNIKLINTDFAYTYTSAGQQDMEKIAC